MNKVAIVILADTSEADGLGRIVNALVAAKEFVDGKDDVQIIFSGAGTKWLGELANPKHKLHDVYNSIKGHIAGACGFCASAFGVTDSVKGGGFRILEEYGTNMSFRKLLAGGYQVITF
jgi:hypothetical protein